MNDPHEPHASELPARSPADPLDERLLDLLVDGELSPAQTRELLARCEDRPESWRRCALAFLEAQTWRRGMGGLRSELPAAAPTIAAATATTTTLAPAAAQNARGSSYRTWLAMAASLLCAFLVGMEARQFWPAAPPAPQPTLQTPVANAQPPVDPAAPAPQLVGRNTLAGGLTWQGADPGRDAVHVPVYTGPDVNEAWLRDLPSQVPTELQQLFERAGRQVEVRRELVPFDLGDGRQVIVPVDELQVQVEPRGYQ